MGMLAARRSTRGFVFSLDAFTAFSLVLVTIYSLFIIINLPKGYYSTLEQGYDIARDSLTVLDHVPDPASGIGETYTQRLLNSYLQSPPPSCSPLCGVSDSTRGGALGKTIPKQWGYMIDYYSNDTGTPAWVTLYDSRAEPAGSADARPGYRKVQASAQTIVSSYSTNPNQGESPECYITGKGYQSPGVYTCSAYAATPCDALNANFLPGQISVGIIRMTVFT